MKVSSVLMLMTMTAMLLGAPLGRCQGSSDSLRIGPADLLHIKVLEAPELEQSVRVTDEGEVQLVLGGNIEVMGMTPSTAARVIENALKKQGFVLNPHVTVTVDQYTTQNVTIVGQVHSPGAYPILTPRSIIDVLAMAGGITDLADRRITIQRHGTKQEVDYVVSNRSSDALKSNIEVYPGDIVLVPKASIVYVLGDVGRPGGYPMETNDSRLSVLQAVALAGGTLPSAVPAKTRLIRKQRDGSYVEINVPLSAMQKGKRSDFQLQADDILYVPFSYLRNMGTSLGGMISAAASASIYRF